MAMETHLLQLCQTKSPRGSKQLQQREFVPRSAFQPTQGKSRHWDLVDQVEECNVKIEELLRTGEASISESTFDASLVSKRLHAENEDGECPDKSSEGVRWEDLDLAANNVLKTLEEQLSSSTELSSFSRSSTSSVHSSEFGECEFQSTFNWSGKLALKRSGSNEEEEEEEDTTPGSNDSHSTGFSNSDDEDGGIEVKTLDCLDDEQLSVHKQCIRGHDLMPHRTPSNMWWCSKCSKQVQSGTRLFGCRICNYDECWSCLSAAQVKVRARSDSATSLSPSEVLLQEVAYLQEQMSAMQDKLQGVMQERDVEITKNRRLQVDTACRMWRAVWSYSQLPAPTHPV